MSEIAAGIPDGKTVYRFPMRKDAIEFALKTAEAGDIVIITGKGHEKVYAAVRQNTHGVIKRSKKYLSNL